MNTDGDNINIHARLASSKMVPILKPMYKSVNKSVTSNTTMSGYFDSYIGYRDE